MNAPAEAAVSQLEAARQQIIRWREGGPALFAVEALGLPEHWDDELQEGIHDWQWEASKLLVQTRRLSIRSGHRVGKSAFMAWTILWFMSCYFPCKAGATAPSATQMSDVLWAELSMWHRRLIENMPQLGEKFAWHVDSFQMVEAPRESFAVARTARKERPEALQGLHQKHMLILVDEASGVPEEIYEAGRGSLAAEHAFVVFASNPTRTSGTFFDTHHKLRNLWATLKVDGTDVPTQSQRFRDEIATQYGKDSNYYRVRVEGEFPREESDSVISLELCDTATQRDVELYGGTVWGVDVARFGDDRTTLVKRRVNGTFEEHKAWHGVDLMQTAGRIYREWIDTEPDRRPATIFVDVIGIGSGVADRLQELQLPIAPINVSESASADDTYLRLRDELWFKARKWLEKRDCKLFPDETLIAELTLPKYKITSGGKIQVESKDEMKKRYPRSPDVADAFCLTFADAAEYAGRQSYEPEVFEDGY